MNRCGRVVIGLVLMGMVLFSGQAWAGLNVGEIPIQHHGRIKPFSAFAQETLQYITGKKRWHGEGASLFLIRRLNAPQQFLTIPFIRIDHPELKKILGLSAEENYFSEEKIKLSLNTLSGIVQSVGEKRNKDLRPSTMEQQAETVYGRVMVVEHLSTGELMTVIPGADGKAWVSPYVVSSKESETFKRLAQDIAGNAPGVQQELSSWVNNVSGFLGKNMWSRVRMEAGYYVFQPFFYAGVFYFLGFLFLLFKSVGVQRLGKIVLVAGFLAHAAGILLRWVILLRPPVANMYETMIFMDLVLMLAVGVFVLFQKRSSLLSSGAIVSALVMLYANLLPVDQSLDVVTPVLRSSYWLTIHVITIISSYSLFAFATGVSHRHLFLSVQGKLTPEEDQMSAHSILRLLQAGLIALGAGTILGGVWANEAWGRFWGWDPKETWAFITFLGYMAILHLRYSKKLTNFGLAVGSILGFLLVMMTWYGVNFILGRGLHSYGSGSGGLVWVVYFLIFELGFLAFVFGRRKKI
ncbi:MAG: cytochrome c biogenesis protein CcsA [Candidatus Omnitrophica bacterium]|nr:cytochrome c biogenesis protein CcsA [Candidatus Omnitrophota bacterium]